MTVHRPTPTARPARPARPHVTSIVITWVYALLPANFVPPIIGGLIVERGLTVELAGLVATAMTLANAGALLAVRPVIARGRRVIVARVGVAILIAAFAAGAFVPEAAVTVAALIVGGVGSGLAVAAATAGASATANPDRTAQLSIIVNRVVLAAGFLFLPLLGGGLTALFGMIAALGVVALLGSQWIPAPPTTAVTEDGRILDRPGSRAVAWLLAISFAVLTLTEDGTYALMQVLMVTNIPTLDGPTISFIYASGVIAGLVGALISPLLLRFVGRFASLAVLLVLSALGKLGLVFATDLTLYIVSGIAWGFAFGAMVALIMGLAASIARSGTAVTLLNGVYVAGVALAPLLATQVFGVIGQTVFGISFLVIAIVGSVGILLAVVRAGRLAPESDTAPVVETAA